MEKENLFKVSNDVDADNLITEIRELQADRNRFEMIYKAKMDQLKTDLERKTATIDSEIEFNKNMLQAYFLTVPAKETKTQKTYTLLSGKLVMKKPTTKLVHDDAKILEYLQAEGNGGYIKNTPKLDWTKFKENLLIGESGTIVTKDGEVLDIEGLKLEQVSEQFEIK